MATPSGQALQLSEPPPGGQTRFEIEPHLTVEQIVALGRSKRRVLLNIQNRVWPSRVSPLKHANGKRVREVPLSALPRDVQAAWLKQQRQTSELRTQDSAEEEASVSTPDSKEIRLIETLKRFPVDVRDAFLAEARRLAKIVEAYDALPQKRERTTLQGGGGNGRHAENTVSRWTPDDGATPAGSSPALPTAYRFTKAVYALCNQARCTDETILRYYESRRHAIRKDSQLLKSRTPSPRTLDNWSRRYKSEGLLAFLPRNATGPVAADDPRRTQLQPAAAEWVNANYKSCPTPRALYRKFLKQARKHNWKTIPSEAWFYRLVRDLPAIMQARLRSKKEHTDKWAFFVPRTVEDLDALEIVCGDHSMRDITVRLADGSLARPWLTLWLCLRTYLIWGWHLDLIPSSRTIGLAYANGIRTFGAQPPATENYQSAIYTDQGRDYKGRDISGRVLTFKQAAKVEGGFDFLLDQHRVGLCNDLQLEQILARGYNAKEKPVERVHKDLSAWEADVFGDGMYCGRDAKTKPDAWKDAFARHGRLLKRARQEGRRNDLLINESPFMLLEDYREALAGWVTEFNNSEHTRTVLGGATTVPFDEYERLYLSRFPGGVKIDDETLALLVMKALPAPRKIDKNGVWLHQRNWWYAHPDISRYKGRYAEVRYSEDDYNYCWVVIHDGPILKCERLTPSTIRNPNKQTMATIAAMKKHEDKTIRDFHLINQSRIRGESVEDRVAAMIEPDVEERVEAIAAEGGGAGLLLSHSASVGRAPARVHQLTRLDRRHVASSALRPVTVDEVVSAPVDETIFETPATSSSVVNPWEGNDE